VRKRSSAALTIELGPSFRKVSPKRSSAVRRNEAECDRAARSGSRKLGPESGRALTQLLPGWDRALIERSVGGRVSGVPYIAWVLAWQRRRRRFPQAVADDEGGLRRETYSRRRGWKAPDRQVLWVRVGENPRDSLSELARLGARLIIERDVEDGFDAWLGRAR
jgi:hypothetical protein